MVICLERGADLHMAQLMPLPLTVSCFSKIQIGFTYLVPAHPGCPEQRAVKRLCMCVLHHSAYVIVDGKVIEMGRAQAVRMFENYSYTVTAKETSRSKGWVSKWTRSWKMNQVESLQSQSRQRLTNKTALNLNAQRIIRNSKHHTLNFTGGLASKFARFVSN